MSTVPARTRTGSAELRLRLRQAREDASFRQDAARLHEDADHPSVRDALLWNLVTEPGDRVAGALVAALGPEDALDYVFGDLSAPPGGADDGGDGRPALRALQEGRSRWGARLEATYLRQAMSTAVRVGLRVLLPGDQDWPEHLADLGDHRPLALWVRGDVTVLSDTGVAIVGARASSNYGEHVAGELAGSLAADGLVVVSGGAYGIDGVAHRAALRAGGKTVAVLAGGLDRAYPAGHAALFERIVADGALVSEVACGGAPTRWRFLERNRVIAALARATVVVEAGWRSGSLNTAGHAATLGRPLGAVPGAVTSATSAGCHRLLRDYDARCVTSAADVKELLGHIGVGSTIPQQDPELERLADVLSARVPRTPEELAQRSGLSVEHVEALLGVLELEGGVLRTERGWRSMPL